MDLLERLKPYTDIVFDYDSTIAKVQIDWPQARLDYRDYLKSIAPDLKFDGDERVDEMESMALRAPSADQADVFRFRHELESRLDGMHAPINFICDLIDGLRGDSGKRLFIISNNLHRTVRAGLEQLGLCDAFSSIIGVDDTGAPKPDGKAFEVLRKSHGVDPRNCLFLGDNDRTDGGFCESVGIDFVNITGLQAD